MDYMFQLKELANQLDRQGLVKQANLIDKYLLRFAQNAPALPADPLAPTENIEQQPSVMQPMLEEPKVDTKEASEKMSRTTFLMLQELRDFYARNLQAFKYLGEDNVKVIQGAVDQLVAMYRVLLRNTSADYNKEALASYEVHLKNLQKEVDRSKKMKVTPTKVKIDKFLLYDEFEILMKKIERHYDSGLRELQPVLKKARAVRDAFGNVIQQTSEQIAHADLIETK